MRKAAAASRYASYDSPSLSPSPSSSRRHVAPTAATAGDGSRALVAVRSGRGDLRCLPPPQPQSHNHDNLGCMLRRLISMDKKPSANPKLPVPPAAIAPAKNSGGGVDVLDKYYDSELLDFFSLAFCVRPGPSAEDHRKLWSTWENSVSELSIADCSAFWHFIAKNWSKNTQKLFAGCVKAPVCTDEKIILLLADISRIAL